MKKSYHPLLLLLPVAALFTGILACDFETSQPTDRLTATWENPLTTYFPSSTVTGLEEDSEFPSSTPRPASVDTATYEPTEEIFYATSTDWPTDYPTLTSYPTNTPKPNPSDTPRPPNTVAPIVKEPSTQIPTNTPVPTKTSEAAPQILPSFTSTYQSAPTQSMFVTLHGDLVCTGELHISQLMEQYDGMLMCRTDGFGGIGPAPDDYYGFFLEAHIGEEISDLVSDWEPYFSKDGFLALCNPNLDTTNLPEVWSVNASARSMLESSGAWSNYCADSACVGSSILDGGRVFTNTKHTIGDGKCTAKKIEDRKSDHNVSTNDIDRSTFLTADEAHLGDVLQRTIPDATYQPEINALISSDGKDYYTVNGELRDIFYPDSNYGYLRGLSHEWYIVVRHEDQTYAYPATLESPLVVGNEDVGAAVICAGKYCSLVTQGNMKEQLETWQNLHMSPEIFNAGSQFYFAQGTPVEEQTLPGIFFNHTRDPSTPPQVYGGMQIPLSELTRITN